MYQQLISWGMYKQQQVSIGRRYGVKGLKELGVPVVVIPQAQKSPWQIRLAVAQPKRHAIAVNISIAFIFFRFALMQFYIFQISLLENQIFLFLQFPFIIEQGYKVTMSSITHKELVQNYDVVRVLGEGSFGKVFLVRHKETNIQFAMKKYSKYHILKNGKEKSLIRSSRILQLLEHNNIIKFIYYAISEEDDEIFMIFEACKKGSLQEIKEKIFEMKEISLVKQIMYQLAQGLQYLKSVAVAHRDIKPSNLSFNSEGELKIIDFDEAICFKQTQDLSNKEQSFARQLMEETSSMKMYSRRSRANSFVGTEMYMCPEMRNMTIMDERGDVWAYGCILFELVVGRSLMNQYEEDDEAEITINRIRQELITYEIEPTDVESITDLLKNILQENPDKRLPIQKIREHQFFRQLRENNRGYYRNKLKKFLRGNFNLSDPRNILDALNMDLIGMKSAPQKFVQLSHYPIFLQYQKRPIVETPSRWSSFKQWLSKYLRMPTYKVCYIFGGSKYFKQRSTINEDDKSYIFYNEIDRIRIVDDCLIISGSNLEKWNRKEKNQEFTWQYVIRVWDFLLQAVSGDQVQLGVLYDMLMYILND